VALSHMLFLLVGLNIAPRDLALLCQKVRYSAKFCLFLRECELFIGEKRCRLRIVSSELLVG
jgi:hypothetical protein